MPNNSSIFTAKRYWLIAIVLYTSLWIIFPIIMYYSFGVELASKIGTILGGLGAYFSGLALLGVIATVKKQTKQLNIQAKELNLQIRTQALSALILASETKAQGSGTNVEIEN
ncbi:MAG: hypothetical protein GY855_05740, partial [candidate division Zixibacteria bacterium]|nr:hypothetical protein [candidate division Zixibacteria bacterium]